MQFISTFLLKSIILLLFFIYSLFLNSQINKNQVKFEKPISDLDSFNHYVKILSSNQLHIKDSIENFITTFITDPKWIKKNKNLNTILSSNEINDLTQIAQIQYDWHYNHYNKEIEKLFNEINERDQRERIPMTECYLKTKNNDSCRKLNNWEFNMIKNDSLNWKIIDSVILKYGFPKSEWLGRKGYNGFMTSYFDHNKDHIIQYSDVWREAGKRDYIATQNLEDSYSLNHCQEQKYNTVFCKDQKTKKSIPCTPCLFKSKCCDNR
jgi:hypothetical protein